MKDNSIENSKEFYPSEYTIGQALQNAKNILGKYLEKPLSSGELLLLRKFAIEGIRKYEYGKEKKHSGVKTKPGEVEWPHLYAVLSFLKHYGIEFPTLYENEEVEKQFNPFGDIEAIDLIKSRLAKLR